MGFGFAPSFGFGCFGGELELGELELWSGEEDFDFAASFGFGCCDDVLER